MMTITDDDVHIDDVKEFYDPHPGFLGAAFSLPFDVKAVVDKLNGQKTSIREAVRQILAITQTGVEVNKEIRGITLQVACHSQYDVSHTFCVIKFR